LIEKNAVESKKQANKLFGGWKVEMVSKFEEKYVVKKENSKKIRNK
jgi:hypothetical protein